MVLPVVLSSSAVAICIRPCDLFQFRITSEILNHFDAWQDSFDGGSDLHKASTYTEQHNTERRGQKAML
jgi:hypothetical protein